MSEGARIFVSLGANLGAPAAQIREAARRLCKRQGLRLSGASSFYQTEPVGPVAQPPFVNAVIEMWASLPAKGVLEALLGVERDMGRRRGIRWGPRTIDLDLLLYGDAIVERAGLRVPHPRMHERRFVLVPLAEVAPGAVHPALGKTASELLADLGEGGGRVERLEESWEEVFAGSR